ncbi:MAG: YigZ family protein [Prolixibacteraceae bacterium]|nr:YigZ family protein [Prolixibacteraceae bacterium]
MNDTYKTISKPCEGFFKDKGSRFISYLYPVETEEEVKDLLLKIKKEHHSARHHCYAWRMGKEEIKFRANDDGEPSSTAGKPILGQLISYDITNAVCVVVRYFGGTLLGVSGLINAYKQAAADALNNADIEMRIIELDYQLNFSYNELNVVMQILKNENLEQKTIELLEHCRIVYSVRKSEAAHIEKIFGDIYGVRNVKL